MQKRGWCPILTYSSKDEENGLKIELERNLNLKVKDEFVDHYRPMDGPTRDITSSLRSTTGSVPTEQNMAYAAFSLAAKNEECIYEN